MSTRASNTKQHRRQRPEHQETEGFTLPGGQSAEAEGPGARRFMLACMRHRERRNALSAAVKAEALAREALVLAVGEHGPRHPETERCREVFASSRSLKKRAESQLEDASDALVQAIGFWARQPPRAA